MSLNDDFHFRPASKGLGFHNQNSNRPKTTSPIQANVSQSIAKPISKPDTMSRGKMSHPTLQRSSSLVKSTLAVDNASLANFEDLASNQNILLSTKKPSFYMRFTSWAIDITALIILLTLCCTFIFQLNNLSISDPSAYVQKDFILNLYLPLGLGFYLFYFMLFERVTGQTLGKLIMGLKVVRLNSDQPPTLVQSFSRNLFNIISFFTMGLLSVYDVVNWSLGLKIVKTK